MTRPHSTPLPWPGPTVRGSAVRAEGAMRGDFPWSEAELGPDPGSGPGPDPALSPPAAAGFPPPPSDGPSGEYPS